MNRGPDLSKGWPKGRQFGGIMDRCEPKIGDVVMVVVVGRTHRHHQVIHQIGERVVTGVDPAGRPLVAWDMGAPDARAPLGHVDDARPGEYAWIETTWAVPVGPTPDTPDAVNPDGHARVAAERARAHYLLAVIQSQARAMLDMMPCVTDSAEAYTQIVRGCEAMSVLAEESL